MREIVEFALIFAAGYLLTMVLVFSAFKLFFPLERVNEDEYYKDIKDVQIVHTPGRRQQRSGKVKLADGKNFGS